MARLDDVLRRCTVRVMVPGGGHGSGAFVAPGLVLTCAHVVESAWAAGAGVELCWQGQPLAATIADYHAKPFPDLALLRVDHTDHPCVWLDDRIDLGDSLYAFGYTDQEPDGDSATLEYEGPTLRPDVPFTAPSMRRTAPGSMSWMRPSGAGFDRRPQRW